MLSWFSSKILLSFSSVGEAYWSLMVTPLPSSILGPEDWSSMIGFRPLLRLLFIMPLIYSLVKFWLSGTSELISER